MKVVIKYDSLNKDDVLKLIEICKTLKDIEVEIQ